MYFLRCFIFLFSAFCSISIYAQFIEIDPDREFLPDIELFRSDTIKEIIVWKAKSFGKNMPKTIGDRHIEAKYNINGKLRVYNIYDNNDFLLYTYRFKYNNNKYLVNVQKFDGQKKLAYQWFFEENLVKEEYKYYLDKDIEYAWFFTYDVLGNKTEEIKCNHYGKIIRRIYFVYNENNKIINISAYKTNDRFDYKWGITYDNNGDTVECHRLNKEYIVQESIIYKYHKKGQLDSVVYIDNNRNERTLQKVFFYDVNGNIVCKITYDYNEMKEIKYLNTYNTNSKLIESVYFINQDRIHKKLYTYNKNQLCINEKKIIFTGITEIENVVSEIDRTINEDGFLQKQVEKDLTNRRTIVYTYKYF